MLSQRPKTLLAYFTPKELALWCGSVFLVVLSFVLFDGERLLTLTASLIGVTSLLFCAKGNPLGQLLMMIFSLLYGVISYTFAYYGEMITYLGMTAPMALFALISWLKNPYNGNRAQVRVNRIRPREWLFMLALTAVITVIFHAILAYFHTPNLLPSTLSVTTSFVAVYLTFRRSPYYAAAYALNDAVLIALWLLAARTDSAYLSVVVCFVMFFVNDIYGYLSWQAMHKRQQAQEQTKEDTI